MSEAALEIPCDNCGGLGAGHAHDRAWCSGSECNGWLCDDCTESAYEAQHADPESIER